MYDPMMSYHFPFTLKKRKKNDLKKYSSVKKKVYVVYACV